MLEHKAGPPAASTAGERPAPDRRKKAGGETPGRTGQPDGLRHA